MAGNLMNWISRCFFQNKENAIFYKPYVDIIESYEQKKVGKEHNNIASDSFVQIFKCCILLLDHRNH